MNTDYNLVQETKKNMLNELAAQIETYKRKVQDEGNAEKLIRNLRPDRL